MARSKRNGRKNSNGRSSQGLSISGGDKALRYTGKTLLTLNRMVGQAGLTYRFPLNPTYFTGAQTVATQFQEFRFLKLEMCLHSNSSLNYLVSYYKVNPVTPPTSFIGGYAAEISRLMAIDDKTPQMLKMGRKDVLQSTRPWWVCNTTQSTGNLEVDDINQGCVFVVNDTPLATTNIQIEIAFEIEFRGPVTPGIALAPKQGEVFVNATSAAAPAPSFVDKGKQSPLSEGDCGQACGCKQHL